MPLLIPLVGVQTATPLVAFMALTTTLMVLWNTWRSIDLRAARQLIVASAVGIPFGLYILTDAPQTLVSGILGMLLIAYGLYSLIRPELPTLTWSGRTYVLGFCAGLLGGAYNTNGPPVVLLGALMRWSPDRFRATIQGYFAVNGLLVLLLHGLSGLWTQQVLTLYAFALPLIPVAVFLGSKLNQRIPAERFERLLYGVLVGFGVLLVV